MKEIDVSRTVVVRLPEHLAHKLDQFCAYTDETRSVVVRLLIATTEAHELIDGRGPLTAEEHQLLQSVR